MYHSYSQQSCDSNTFISQTNCLNYFDAINKTVLRKKAACASFWKPNEKSFEMFICPYRLTTSLLHYGHVDEALLFNVFMLSKILTAPCPKCSLVPAAYQVAYKRMSNTHTLQLKKYISHKNLISQLTLAMFKKKKVTLDFVLQLLQPVQHILNFVVILHTRINQQSIQEFFNNEMVPSLHENVSPILNVHDIRPQILCLLTNINFFFRLLILPTFRNMSQPGNTCDTPSIVLAMQCFRSILLSEVTPDNEKSTHPTPCSTISHLISFWMSFLKKPLDNMSSCSMHSHSLIHLSEALFNPTFHFLNQTSMTRLCELFQAYLNVVWTIWTLLIKGSFLSKNTQHPLCEDTLHQLTNLMYDLLLDLFSQKHLLSSETFQNIFNIFLNPSTIMEQISLFPNILFSTDFTTLPSTPVCVFFFVRQIVKCLHRLAGHWAPSLDYYMRLCYWTREFSNQVQKNCYGVSFQITHKKLLLVLLQNLLPCLCTVVQNDLKHFREKESDLQNILTFDSRTLSKAMRLTKEIFALSDLYETILLKPSHEDSAFTILIKENYQEEEKIVLKIHASTEQFCYETYNWLLTIRKFVPDFSNTSLKHEICDNNTRLSLLNLLESLTIQRDSLNLFSMNSLIPSLNEKVSNNPYTFQCVTQKDLPIISVIEEFLRLILRLTRFLLTWNSNKTLMYSSNPTENKAKPLTTGYFCERKENVKPFTDDGHSLLKFTISIVSFYVGSFCYAQCIVSELLHHPGRLLYVESSAFLLDIVNVCLKLVTTETFQFFSQTFMNVYKMFAFFSKKFVPPWDPLDSLLFDYYSLIFLKALTSRSLRQIKDQETIALCPFTTCYGKNATVVSFLYHTFLYKEYSCFMQSTTFCTSHRNQGTPISTKCSADLSQEKDSPDSSLLFNTFSDENVSSHTPRPTKLKQTEIVKPVSVMDQTLESFTHLFFRRVHSFLTNVTKRYDALLKENVTESVLLTHYFKIIVNTNLATLELLVRLPYHTQVLRFLIEKTFDTRQFVKDLYSSILKNNKQIPFESFHSFLLKAMDQQEFKINRSIAECIFHILHMLITVLFFSPYDIMIALCPQLKPFHKTWMLANVTPYQKELNLHFASLTIVGFQNLEYIYYKKIAKKKKEEFFYNALFWSACFQQQVEGFSYDYETKFALLPLTHLSCSLNRLKILASWKLKKPLAYRNSVGFWNSINARKYVKSYYDEICAMSLHPMVEQSSTFLTTLVSFSVSTIQFLCVNWDDPIDSDSNNIPSAGLEASSNFFEPKYLNFLKLLNHARASSSQFYDNLLQLFNCSTSAVCPTLVLLQKTINKSCSIQQCITTLYERVHSLLISKILIPNLIPLMSWNNLEYLSVNFWLDSVDKAQLTHQIYTLWENLSSTLLIGREVFDLLYTPFIYKNMAGAFFISNENSSCPHTIFPLCIVALTAPVWVYFLTNTHTTMSKNFCNLLDHKKTLLCLELTLYMLYLSISLSRSTVMEITSGSRQTLQLYAKQWQEASEKLFHIANEKISFSTFPNTATNLHITTPRRHVLNDATTFSSKKTDWDTPENTHKTALVRLVSHVHTYQLEALRLLNNDSQYNKVNQKLLSSLEAAKHDGNPSPSTFSTADVIRLSTSFTSFYLQRPYSTSIALLCATEAFSECYFLRHLNENCLSSETTCYIKEKKNPFEAIQFQDESDEELFKYNHLMPIDTIHPTMYFEESFWSMPNVLHETSTLFEFHMESLSSTCVKPLHSFQTSQSRQVFHFAYLMINAAVNLLSSWLSIGDDHHACDVLVTTLVTLSYRLVLPLPYYNLAIHLLCLQIHQTCTESFSFDTSPSTFKNSFSQSTILYLLPALYQFWFTNFLPLSTKNKKNFLLLHHPTMSTPLIYTVPIVISNTYPLHSLYLLFHKLLQLYEILTHVFPILTTCFYNKNEFQKNKPLFVTYDHMFFSISFLYIKLFTLSQMILTLPCFQRKSSLKSIVIQFIKIDQGIYGFPFVKCLKIFFQSSIKIFFSFSERPAFTSFQWCMEILDSFYECTKTFLTTLKLYKEFHPLPQNVFSMTLIALVLSLTSYIVAQYVGSQWYSKLSSQIALKALKHLFQFFKSSSLFCNWLNLYYEVHDFLVLNLAKHTRFSSMYSYRCLQKKFIKTNPTLKKVVMDTAEFLLRHHYYVMKTASSTTPVALELAKKFQLVFPIEWTIIIIEIEKKNNFLRLHFWRYIPKEIQTYLMKHLPKNACLEEQSNWFCNTSDWIPEIQWISLQQKLQSIREQNYASAKETLSVHSEIPFHELPLARRTRQGKKKCESNSIQRWWQKRFSVETELYQWLDNLEQCFNKSFPLLHFVSGWPTSFLNQSFLTLLDVAANICKVWCDQLNHVPFMDFLDFYHFVHFTFIFSNFHVECQLSCPTLLMESSLKVGYENYFKYCFEKHHFENHTFSSKKLWKSFLSKPVHTLTQYLLSIIPLKTICFPLQKYLPSHFKTTVYGISNYPILLFLNSHNLFSYEIPWNALPTLRGQNITLGIDISVSQAFYLEWVNRTSSHLDPRFATKFLVINPSDDNSLPQKAIPHEWIPPCCETSNLIFNDIFLNTIPQAQAILYNLCNKDIYIYCGHGGGAQFIHPQKIQSGYVSTQDSLQGKRGATIKAISLLMGCSSIKFFRKSPTEQSEVNSFAFNFHIGGAPSILGLLWDVTDHDLDRFTLCCLSAWCNVWEYYDAHDTCTSITTLWGALSHSKRIARTSCYLKWLTGAACIQTGLPF